MENLRKFRLKSGADDDAAWEVLEIAGVVLHSAVEEADGTKELFGVVPEGFSMENFPFLESVEPVEYPDIDWTAQWESHALNYRDGVVEVELPGYPSVVLVPGPGFGDLSHPTTRLVLRMMAKYVDGGDVVDVGSGSGVLSLAAVAMGAKRIVGVDIDAAAVAHAQGNAARNGMEGKVQFCLSEELAQLPAIEKPLVVMNMIRSEQEVAWMATVPFVKDFAYCVTSGVRCEEREEYLAQTVRWGWLLVEEQEEEGWLAFVFAAAAIEFRQ